MLLVLKAEKSATLVLLSVFVNVFFVSGNLIAFLSLHLSHSLCLFQTQTPNFTISLSYTLSLSLYPSRSLSLSLTRTHTHLLFSLSLSFREGLSPPLAYTPLSEAWSDHLFYFSTLSFKKSGNYTVSFLLEVRPVRTILQSPLKHMVHRINFLLLTLSHHHTSSSYLEPQGKEASGVKPLVFPVTVSSKVRRSGAPAALDRLQASRYMNVSAVQDHCSTN